MPKITQICRMIPMVFKTYLERPDDPSVRFWIMRNCCHWYRPTKAPIFNVQGSVHHKYIPFDIFATNHSLIISGKLLCLFQAVSPPIIRSTNNCTYSIWYLLNFTATYLYRGRVGGGLSVVWEFYRLVQFPQYWMRCGKCTDWYKSHTILRPAPTLPR